MPMPTQPATLTATRVATKAMSTFFIGVPLIFTPRDAHFVPRCTIGRPLPSTVHRLRRQWGTSKGTVSLGTQLGARHSFAACFSAGTGRTRGSSPIAPCGGLARRSQIEAGNLRPHRPHRPHLCTRSPKMPLSARFPIASPCVTGCVTGHLSRSVPWCPGCAVGCADARFTPCLTQIAKKRSFPASVPPKKH